MAEAILRHLGEDRVTVYSAGSEPSRVHPDTFRTLGSLGISTAGLTSKHLKEFIGQDFDYVVTVCDKAREACPVFPGRPAQLHWSYPDPSAVEDEAERLATFRAIASGLMDRNKGLLAQIEGAAAPDS
jgi:protein-tyrosine-phosphatase